MTEPRALVDHRRAQLARYVPWLARDYFANQGPATAIVLLLIGFLSLQGIISAGMALRDAPPALVTQIFRQLMGTLAFLGAFFGTNGIVSNDRKLGYYKFLFSKPVAPPSYYAVTFAVHGVGLLVVTAVLLAIWTLVVPARYSVGLFAVIALMYVAYGGIGFLLSAAWRFDWLSLVTVLFVANVGWSLWQQETGIRYWLLHVLPPVHKADSVYRLALAAPGDPVAWGGIAWLAGYGFACFLLGMLVIRKRSLGSS